ncbi:chromosome segregation protein SMC [Fulvivirgaceae bacterium LMO-SS25]
MLLTRLEIKGFKSFGDRIVINFDEGVTGIVGPNGCGKSNVVDAIRWVLGEQKTRMLRSDKMENVIFNGTKNRKPTQLAEVSLTFSNTKNLLPTEYTSVTVTRRYYRSGESEYQLNGVTCRLKDITDLFMDTGISSNSYSIIELKMVDDILNDKDNSRRQLFEEAAGISKFKKRKKDTLKRLEDTEGDLNRVEDLLFEINKNMKSLERQAKQTEKYYELKSGYKQFSISLGLKQSEDFRNSEKKLLQQLTTEENGRASFTAEIAQAEAIVEKSKAELIQFEKLLASRQKTLNEHVNKIRQQESDKKIKNERLKYLSERAKDLQSQIEKDKESKERADFSLKGLRGEYGSLQKMYDEVESQLLIFKTALDDQKIKTDELQSEVNKIRADYKKLQEDSYQHSKSLEIKEIQLNSLKLELDKTAIGSQEKYSQLESFDQKIEELQKAQKKEAELLEFLKREEAEILERREESEQLLEQSKENLQKLKRQLDAKENEYKLTKSLVENLEGFPEAIKYLKKNVRWGKDTPLLSDIITCDEKYRVAIENYLEHYMNYFVVEKESNAFEAVNVLGDSNRGKANFFILSKIGEDLPAQVKIPAGGIRAIDIVEYDTKFNDLVQLLLGNVFLFEADHLTEPEDGTVFLNINGRLARKKISISGGSVGLFEGKKIGRAKNLEKLSKDIKFLNAQIEKLEDITLHQQERVLKLKQQSKKTEIDATQQNYSRVAQELSAVTSRKDQLQQFINSEATRKEDIQDSITDLQEDLTTLRPEAEQARAQLALLEKELSEKTQDLQKQNELLNVKSAGYNQQNILFHQQKNKLESTSREIEYKEQSLATASERILKNQDELKNAEIDIKKLLEQSEEFDDSLLNLYDEKETIEKGVNEAERDYYRLRGEIDTQEKNVREIQKKKENGESLIFELKGALNEVKLQIQSLMDRISVEFEVNLKSIEEGEKDDLSIAELEQNIRKIKDQMDRLGPINPMAMEAYNEIKERFDFITAQKLDLVQAKESLLSTIDEINTVAKENFMEAFDKIQKNFVTVFRSLFTNEDDCSLILSDPDNPLESSIEITAKPKGKRPLSINQLSGGEKTLTATSLLFAIYLLKPAPFCIFDEVDAPLDDANIDKFNNIIRTFSKDSQFIIVTHNKRTMASTDIIYGITMIEQGVSRVVPVDLREAV